MATAALAAHPMPASAQARLGTDRLFHELALDPAQRLHRDKDFGLPFDAIVVGVEKDHQRRVGSVSECNRASGGAPSAAPNGASNSQSCLDIGAPYFAERPEIAQRLRPRYLNQPRPTFVSHIAAFSAGQPDPCFIYNVYAAGAMCEGHRQALPRQREGVANSWAALDTLRLDLLDRVARLQPSHLVVVVMGWNTPQWEALQNYRDLHAQLTLAAAQAGDDAFKPLFIGLTWPSTGSPLIPASDFGFKAGDADEVGAVWGNLLINRALADVKHRHGTRVVVLGHSFGARSSSRAVFSAPLVRAEPFKVVDLLVGLQGAYSFQRYLSDPASRAPAGIEGAPYRDFPSFVGKAVLTTSAADTAVRAAHHGEYFVGSSQVFELTRAEGFGSRFEHAVAPADGRLDNPSCDSTKVLFIDATAVIANNVPGTGGGAHSDIYNAGVGRLIHSLVRACAR